METTVNPTVTFLGIEFDLTILAMSLLTVGLAFAFIYWASRQMTLKPKGKQNVLEYAYEFVEQTIKSSLGHYTKRYSLLFFSLFFFVLIANNIGLMTKLEVNGYNFWTSPTTVAAYDFGLALLMAVVTHVEGVRKRGFKGYLKGYLAPLPIMLPMNLLEEFTNVISLTLRLYGNIYAGEIVLALVVKLANSSLLATPFAIVLAVLWIAFSVFISAIQAYVFVILTATYLGHKINHEEN